MRNGETQNFISFYDIEAQGFGVGLGQPSVSIWKLLLKATGIFFVMTFIVFFISNYQYIRSQIVDWHQGSAAGRRIMDEDEDGIPKWWEEKYGFNDNFRSDAFFDPDGDLANNLLEYRFGTDPLNPDTDGDGYLDGLEIMNGYNPNGYGMVDRDDDGIPDWWEEQFGLDKNNPLDAVEDFDGDGVSNIDEYGNTTNPWEKDSDHDSFPDGDEISLKQNPSGEGPLGGDGEKSSGEKDSDGDGLSDFFEEFFGTDPFNSDTDADGFDDFRELSRGYDPTGAGMIKATIGIPAISVEAPIVWSQKQNEESIQKDLEKGVVHYPTTAFPAMRGNAYITGHSSYYSWSKSPFKEVFKELDRLQSGDAVFVDLEFSNGNRQRIIYRVVSNEVVLADDARLWRKFESPELTLVTCWPIGTDWKRVMVKANLAVPVLPKNGQ